ncbi:DUF6712 family protein [Aquirufa nivalisilvae]
MLIKNEVELKNVLGGVQQSISWSTIEPFVKQAELKYIVDEIGREFYDQLSATPTPNVKEAQLLEYLTIASGYYALGIGLPQLIATFGDMGVSFIDKAQVTPLTKWAYSEILSSSIKAADDAMESAMAFLDNNSEDFSTWNGSPERAHAKSLFLSSASDLTLFFPPVKESRRLYKRIRGYISKVEEYQLKPLLGKDFMDYLKSSTDSEKQEKLELLSIIKHYLANKSFAEAIPFLNLSDDFKLMMSSDSVIAESFINTAGLDQTRREELRLSCEEAAQNYLKKTKDFLIDNASNTVFPSFYASAFYAILPKTKSSFTKNDPSKPYVIF